MNVNINSFFFYLKAIDFLKKLLERNERKRLTAFEGNHD